MKQTSEIDPAGFVREIRRLARKEEWYEGMVERVGKQDPFKVLISCILSLRTKDELTEKKSLELWRRATTPRGMIGLGPKKLARIIYPVGFYRRKAAQIVALSRILISEYSGKVPDTIEQLMHLPGVGRKTANLVVSVGFNKPGICVDTHVHRITNRWGYVSTKTPDKTEMALREKLPARLWKDINRLLVYFGKTVCTPVSPKCSICPLKKQCPAKGVEKHR